MTTHRADLLPERRWPVAVAVRRGKCRRPMGGDCCCYRPGGHDGLHECNCTLYGSEHGVKVEFSHSLFGGHESRKAGG